ncbi:MAG: hypothetical protein OK454_09925, partial [Thaumarchaeota archaeon]|nr:hypothetical protein [Nitrososphaerota archaeon]
MGRPTRLTLLRRNYGSGTTQEVEDASLLAGYILTLIRCFPDYGDDIRMRLYLADITSRAGRTPSVKFFWNAMSRTAVFSNVFADENSALNFLRRRKYFQASDNSGVESAWDREWRMVLLFLELYIFVLRLTDDDDFFNAIGSSPMSQADSSSRLRSCGLRLDELKRLTIFLRNLAFTLYYNAASLLQEDISRGVPSVPMDELWGTSSSRRSARDAAKADGKTSSGYRVVSGVDFNAFKGIVTTAMRMLYERDSRRRFLPSGHWLMTSRFDMEGFLGAVVQEEERRHEMA